MIVEEELLDLERRLCREASSFAEFLNRLRERISPRLIGDTGWERLLERVLGLPVTVAADAFGFELPLHRPNPGADLGITVNPGTRGARFFEVWGGHDDAALSSPGIARLLGDALQIGSPLARIALRTIMLEYDIESASPQSRPGPAVFVRPRGRATSGDQLDVPDSDLDVVLDGLDGSSGWGPDLDERSHVKRVNLARGTRTHLFAVGAFPSRGRGIRLAIGGLQNACEAAKFLDRVGWTGEHSTVTSTIADFQERDAFSFMNVNLHVTASGVGPVLGVSLFPRKIPPGLRQQPFWWSDPKEAVSLIEGLSNSGLCDPKKLSELAKWSSRPTRVFGKSGEFILLQGIQHVKLAFTGNRIEQAKAYVYLKLVAGR